MQWGCEDLQAGCSRSVQLNIHCLLSSQYCAYCQLQGVCAGARELQVAVAVLSCQLSRDCAFILSRLFLYFLMTLLAHVNLAYIYLPLYTLHWQLLTLATS